MGYPPKLVRCLLFLAIFSECTGSCYAREAVGSASVTAAVTPLHKQVGVVAADAQVGAPTRDENRNRSPPSDNEERQRAAIAALDRYFARTIQRTQRRTGVEVHSKKKQLIPGKADMMMSKDANKLMGAGNNKDMGLVMLTDDPMFNDHSMDNKEKEKMMEMVDHMLSEMMHSNHKKSFTNDMVSTIINGHKTDIVHGFEHPGIEHFNDPHNINFGNTGNGHFSEENFLNNFAKEISPIQSGIEFASEARVDDGSTDKGEIVSVSDTKPGTLNNLDTELQFTTLEVDLGPAILPLLVPEGYFVPFIPRKAFGVSNGVARPPHGHASFYLYRPPGLVDVPNSPAFGFLFSGHTRAAASDDTGDSAR